MTKAEMRPTLGCPCGETSKKRIIEYMSRPVGETAFAIDGEYARYYDKCLICGHFFSSHEMCLDDLYAGAYSEATYGRKREETFERIMDLPEGKSDNFSRCNRIELFFRDYAKVGYRGKLLDIGSGLGVFPARMTMTGWTVTALDPDPKAIEHIRSKVGCDCICADFLDQEFVANATYDLITFNKVLEHVEEPLTMLTRSKALLGDGGIVYIELPDGENAVVEGAHREEFFIEHHHAFSATSAALLVRRAGLRMIKLEVLREASGKYTIALFCDKGVQQVESC